VNVAYQSPAYAQRYLDRVNAIRQAETRVRPGSEVLAAIVARSLFKLMAYKDEYEVARLMSHADFAARLAQEFEGPIKLSFHLAPPLFSRLDPATGRPRKRVFGGYMMGVFRLLARGNFLRGTRLDPFGYAEERGMERQLLSDYEQLLGEVTTELTEPRFELAEELLRYPEEIRGFGPVKKQAVAQVSACREELLRRWRAVDVERAA
jgi:indolepyruvate ferredoxin oxidoreductase